MDHTRATAIDTEQDNGFFCILPFTEIYTGGKTATPCCVFKPINRIALDGYTSNPEMLEVKTTLLKRQAPVQCQECVRQEKISGASLRTLANKFHQDLARQVVDQGMDYTILENLSINTSNICNLKCLPCENASYIRSQELYQLGIYKEPAKMQKIDNFEHVLSLFPRKLTFVGGEPLFDNTFEILEGYVKNGKSKDIALDINTNLTNLTEPKLDFLLANFRSVLLKGSIDGIGIVNNYLRYPSDWNRIEQAVDYVLTRPELGFVITTALSNLALLRYHELVQWAHDKKIKDLFISYVSSPEVLSCNNFFEEHADNCRQNFESLLTLPNMSNRTKYCLDMCIELCNNSKQPSTHRENLKRYLDLHDSKRQTSWSVVFPELKL